MLQDPLSDTLAALKNAERIGKGKCIVRSNKLIAEILRVMKENNYIGHFEAIDDGKGGKFKIELRGKLIDTNVIKPRFAVGIGDYEKFERRFLPARNIGLLIVSTPKGLMAHHPPKYPAMMPMDAPSSRPVPSEITATYSVMRAPPMIRARMSRPRGSPPRKNSFLLM